MNPAWLQADHVLCVRLDNMGDVLMTTPAMRALRQARPSRRLTLLGSAAGVRAAAHIPEIDATIRYEAPWIRNGRVAEAGQPCCNEIDRVAVEVLAAHRFEAAVIFTAYSQSPLAASLMCLMAGIPLRLAHCRENPYLLLTDWVPETEPVQRLRHETERQLDLVSGIAPRPDDLRLSFTVAAHERASLARKLVQAGIDPGEELVVVHPGASAPSRCYPAERFAEAVRELLRRQHRPIVITGDGDEATVAAQVAAGACTPPRQARDAVREALRPWRRSAPVLSRARIVDFSGRLSLGELGALIEGAAVLIANNTGPVHIAAALGTPVVDLYALTNPQHRPWKVPSRVLNRDVPCRNCYKSVCPVGTQACLTGVPVAEVVSAALDLLRSRPRGAARVPPAAQVPLAARVDDEPLPADGEPLVARRGIGVQTGSGAARFPILRTGG